MNLAAVQDQQTPQPSQPSPVAQAPEAPPPPATREQVREQIREQVREQVEAAREAARAAREAAQTSTVAPEVILRTGTEMPPFRQPEIPREVVAISIALFVAIAFMVVFGPIARAIARRIDRRSAAPQLDSGIASQLQRIEHTVDAMSIEVERISEAQRYMARLETERGREVESLRAGDAR